MPSQLRNTIPASHETSLFTVESTTQFAKMLKQCDECYCFMLNFTHFMAHGGDKAAKVNQNSEQMIDKLEKEYLAEFCELKYPIWEYRKLS